MPQQTDVFVVTGALGWLGKRLTRLLAGRSFDGEALDALPLRPRLRCLVLPGQNGDELRAISGDVEVIEGDLRNPADCQRLCAGAQGATLLHTAGIIHPGRVREFFDINTRGAQNLLEAAAQAGMRRAVMVSSNSPIGCNPHPDHLFDEQSPYNPYMNYGRSKMLMELAVQEMEKSGRLETVIIRPPWFYGPDQPPRQTLFFSMIREGKGPIVGSGDNLRSMAYVDNICQGLVLAAFSAKARGQIYWIADRQPYTMNQVIDTIERLLEEEFHLPVAHKRMRLPGLASEVAMAIDATLQKAGMYHQKIHVLSEMNKTIACSIEKAQRELNYQPKIALEEGMRRSIQWCLDQGIKI
jgi:nucleoside-diphosphate-sugar epimerase